jgi:hypothetical protein
MAEQQYSLPGVNVLLEGPSGTGKTHIVGTLADAGIEVFFLALESGYESLAGYWTDKGKPIPPNVHWHKVSAPNASFKAMIDSATKINTLPLDALSRLADPGRSQHNQFIKVLEALNDFPDDRTGLKFGAVDSWDQSRAIVVDGMTGISNAALSLVVGGKPVRSQADWGMAQNTVEPLIRMLCDNCKCHFVLLAHVERETDMVLGGVKLMTSTLGKALAPKIPAMFSDVILTVRNGDKWSWDTASTLADVKTRNLPIRGDITPGFGQIIEKWKSRQKEQSA